MKSGGPPRRGSWPVTYNFLEHLQILKQQGTWLTVLRRIDACCREIVVVRKLHSLSEEPVVDGRLVAHIKQSAITLVLFDFIRNLLPRVPLLSRDLRMICEWMHKHTNQMRTLGP